MCSDICKSIRCHECHWASMGHNSGIQMNQKGWGILREQQGIKYWIPISILSNLKIIWLCCIDFFPLKCIVEIVNLMALARGILILLNVYCVVDTLWGFPGGSDSKAVNHWPATRETRLRSLGREDPLEKEMATHSSTLAWKMPWMEEPGRLQSMRSQRVVHSWVTSLSHASKVMLKILQARLQEYGTRELPDVQAGFRKGRGTRNQIADILWITEKAREF